MKKPKGPKRVTGYLFLKLKVTNGLYEYQCPSVHILRGEDPKVFADEYAKGFYSNLDDTEDDKAQRLESGRCFFGSGTVAVEVYQYKLITRTQFLVLRYFL